VKYLYWGLVLLLGYVRALWWWVRGVGMWDYRSLCKRCGRTGQAHCRLAGCWRFKR